MAASSIHTSALLSDIDFPQQLAAYPELEPYLLKGVRQTAECKRLGNGSFGVVNELYVQGTLCAVKQLHTSLLNPRTQGVDRVISRFVEEYQIMTSVRHPNIVQFLGLHIFPNSIHPTLVMEKLAMSLEDLLNEKGEKAYPSLSRYPSSAILLRVLSIFITTSHRSFIEI